MFFRFLWISYPTACLCSHENKTSYLCDFFVASQRNLVWCIAIVWTSCPVIFSGKLPEKNCIFICLEHFICWIMYLYSFPDMGQTAQKGVWHSKSDTQWDFLTYFGLEMCVCVPCILTKTCLNMIFFWLPENPAMLYIAINLIKCTDYHVDPLINHK